jgi:alkaline phosphatase
MKKKIFALLLCLALSLSTLAACAPTTPQQSGLNPASQQLAAKIPKYMFLFVGDGMSHVQVNAAQVYRGNNTSGEVATKNLNFAQFPIAGVATTHDSTSFCPDSASTATSVATGVKTHSGVIGLGVDKKTVAPNICEQLKEKGKKIGIISSVTINHATPAAFYAHVASRNDYYDIAMQMADSGFDYFAGGSINQATGKDEDKPDAYGIMESKGYKVIKTKAEIEALGSSSGKVYAVSPVLQDSGAIPYTIDSPPDSVSLADFVKKGIDVLDNEKGFFLMAESGKIDWACHANDALSTITDVLGFEEAIQVAVDFANQHPDETLILVTGDHETGGMTIGYAATGYDTAFSILKNQKMSYIAFDELIGEMKESNPNLKLSDVLPIIKENFGLIPPSDEAAKDEANKAFVLTEYEYNKLKNGFAESMKPEEKRSQDENAALLYGTYDPLSVTLTHIINNKAGIGWTSYAHTGTPVPVYAYGAGAELFSGSYDNTDIYKKMAAVSGI